MPFRNAFVALFFLLSFPLMATELSPKFSHDPQLLFNQIFKLKYYNGVLVEVRVKKDKTPSFEEILASIKEDFLSAQKEIRPNQSLLESELLGFVDDGDSNVFIKILNDALTRVDEIDLSEYFNNPTFQRAMDQLAPLWTDYFLRVPSSLLAKPQEKRFFYTRSVGQSAFRNSLRLIRMLDQSSYVALGIQIISEVQRLTEVRREFYQNKLLYFLENFEEELGIRPQDVNLIVSSIYESRIPTYALWESRRAVDQWFNYGFDQLSSELRMGRNRILRHRNLYLDRGSALNFAFYDIMTIDGERVIINGIDSHNLLSSRPAISYYFSHPERVKRMRRILRLAQVGVHLLPLPSFVRGPAQLYFSSFYRDQEKKEGALQGFLLMHPQYLKGESFAPSFR